MRKNYMKGILAALCLVSTSALSARVVEATKYTDYTGDSFVAHWEGPSLGMYALSVFKPGAEVAMNETFNGINHTNGKINASDANIPAEWELFVSENGETDMVTEGTKNHLVLDATGDSIRIKPIVGCKLNELIVNAELLNADGVAQEKTAIFSIEIYNQAGGRITGGNMYTYYFTQLQELNLFEDAFGYVPSDIGYFKIALVKDNGAVGDLKINSISYKYSAPDYVLDEEKVVNKTQYKVEGLDPEEEYFYFVKHSSAPTELSNIYRVNEFMDVKALQPTDVTSTSYTANWEYLPKADGYVVQNYRYETIAEDQEISVVSDDFSKITEGTIDNPIEVDYLDEYTNNPGWGGRRKLIAEGMLGADNGSFPQNIAYLYTPEMNLDGNNGVYTVHIKAYGTPGDYLSLYRVDYVVNGGLNIHKVYFGTDGWADETYEMTDGAKAMKISIEENNIKRYFLDEFSVTQHAKAGDTRLYTLETVNIEGGDVTSYTFSDLLENGTYGYTVTGMRYDDFLWEEYSEVSEVIVFTLGATEPGVGIEDNTADNIKVAVMGNTVHVSLVENVAIELYTLDGRLVKSVEGVVGENSFTVPATNVYVMKVGAQVFKLIAR